MDDELYHYGIPGMRWGFRKANYTTSSNPSKGISRREVKKIVNDYNEIHGTNIKAKNAVITKGRYTYNSKGKRISSSSKVVSKNASENVETNKKKDPFSDMSTDDLKSAVLRLNMEKQYRELTKPQLTIGQKFANECKNIVVSSAKDAASNYTKKLFNEMMNEAVSSAKNKKSK